MSGGPTESGQKGGRRNSDEGRHTSGADSTYGVASEVNTLGKEEEIVLKGNVRQQSRARLWESCGQIRHLADDIMLLGIIQSFLGEGRYWNQRGIESALELVFGADLRHL